MKIQGKELKIIGHRGAAGLEPENTLLGIRKALDLECEMIEVDARLSKDGHIVLIHDLILGRTTNGSGLVSKKNLQELKKLDAGKKEKIPTLEEAWNLIKKGGELNIELKGLKKQTAEKVIMFIEKEKIKNRVLISSRFFWLLRKIKKYDPLLRTGFVSSSYLPFWAIWQALYSQAESIHMLDLTINSDLILKAHQKNLKVYSFPYGVTKENPQKIKKLIEKGTDGIFLNDPTALKKII